MLRENDEKSQSLKLASSEIIELRKQIKLLQSENQIIKKNQSSDDVF